MIPKILAIVFVALGGCYLFGLTRRQQIRSAIQIAAPPEKVWAILTNFTAYKDWNPFIQSLTGTAAVGQRIAARMRPLHSGASRSFAATVLVADEAHELRWRGRLLVPAIFQGDHRFLLEAVDIDGVSGTRFQSNEDFTGFLLLFFDMSDYVPSFDVMNEALKKRAEAAPFRAAQLPPGL